MFELCSIILFSLLIIFLQNNTNACKLFAEIHVSQPHMILELLVIPEKLIDINYLIYVSITTDNNNNNNNNLYYLEFRACDIRVHAIYILFYMQRYSYALLITLTCSWVSDFDILFVMGSYLSGWYILPKRRCCTLISLSVAAADTGRLRKPRDSFLFCPNFLGS